MTKYRGVAVAGLAVCLAGGPARADDKKGPAAGDQLVGTWVVTKAPAGIGLIQKGTTFEFRKDGKLVTEVRPGAGKAEGTYVVEGDKLTIQDKAGKMTLLIKALTGDRLALGGQDGIEFARKTD